ncbi:MAG: TonB-dependent receptor [Bacteroidales bacterium]|nr:TonB-dependent receptor [Bacteroidales bacterium]
MMYRTNIFRTAIFALTLFYSGGLYPQTGGQTLRGKVFDIETQEPLAEAYIHILNTDPIIQTSSDADGNFSIRNVSFGRHAIQVTYMGYEPSVISELVVTSGKEVLIEVGLKQIVTQMNEVTVNAYSRKGKPINTMASVSARSFTVEEAERYAGGMSDPARLVSASAGVSVGDIHNNAIIVRGNAPQGVSWHLEGVEIPAPHHFSGANVAGGGFVTLFSSQMLANSDFFTGAFPAEYGNALAAVFDMKFRSGNAEKRENTFQIGIMGIDFASEGPISRKSKSSYLFNYRYSTMGLLTDTKIIDTEEKMKYQDLSFKLNFPTKKAGTFSIWGIGGIDNLIEPFTKDSLKWETDYDRKLCKWDTYMGATGINHKIITGENTYLNSSVAFSGVMNKLSMMRISDQMVVSPDMYLVDNSGNLTFNSIFNHKFNSRLTLKTGLTYKRVFYNLDMSNTENSDPATYQNYIKEKGNADAAEAYIQTKYDLSSNLAFNLGLNTNYFGVNKSVVLGPRIGVRWDIFPGHTLSFGYGLHSRSEELKIYLLKLGTEYPNRKLKPTKAHHFILGYDWHIKEDLHFKAEVYYQKMYDVPGIADSSYSMINYKQDWYFHESLGNNSTGYNYGLDLTFEKFLSKNYYYLVTCSLFDSKYKADDGVWRNTRYNKNYVANILFGKEFFYKDNTRVLGINGRLSFLGGEHESPILKDESILLKNVVYDENRAFENQMPSVFYVDFTVNYRINKKRHSSLISLQIKNLLNSPINEGYEYYIKTKEVKQSTISAIVPSISYKIEF